MTSPSLNMERAINMNQTCIVDKIFSEGSNFPIITGSAFIVAAFLPSVS